jgi:GTP-binding protein Era
MHKPKNKLGNYMVKTIDQSVMGVDIAVLVVEAGKEISQTELSFIEKLKKLGLPCVLVINKIDLIKDKSDIIKQIDNFSKIYEFKAIVPLSAKKTSDEGVMRLIDELMRLSEPGEHLFEEDALTDQPERVIVAEIIREKMLKLLDEEVPHGTAVEIEKMKQRDNNEITDIDAVIYCEKDSHKGMIIGKQGAALKRIGTYARQDIESFFETKINLKLWVKVKTDWRNKDFDLRNFGFNKNELKI